MNFSYKLGGLKGSSFRFAFANILSSFTFDENLLNFQVKIDLKSSWPEQHNTVTPLFETLTGGAVKY